MSERKLNNKIDVVKICRTDENGSRQYVVTPINPTLEYKQSRATIWELLGLKEGESCTIKVTRGKIGARAFNNLEEIDEL